jgi:hypothetical protein
MPVLGVPSAFIGACQDSLATPVAVAPPPEPLAAGLSADEADPLPLTAELAADEADPPPLPQPARETITRKDRNETDKDLIVFKLSPFFIPGFVSFNAKKPGLNIV